MKYNRILLKLSGESLQGAQGYGLSTDVLHSYAAQIRQAVEAGVQVAVVIGGGNIFRGLQGAGRGFDRVKGDQMGMLATIINSLALQSALENDGVRARVLTSIRMEPIGEYYAKARALEYLAAGEVVIIGGGTSSSSPSYPSRRSSLARSTRSSKTVRSHRCLTDRLPLHIRPRREVPCWGCSGEGGSVSAVIDRA